MADKRFEITSIAPAPLIEELAIVRMPDFDAKTYGFCTRAAGAIIGLSGTGIKLVQLDALEVPEMDLQAIFRLATDEGTGRVDIGRIWSGMYESKESNRFYVVLTGQDLFIDTKKNDYAFGGSAGSVAAVSSRRFRWINKSKMYLCMEQLMFHELGHMFGLPGRDAPAIEMKYGAHCTNLCTMQQGMSVRAFTAMAEERMRRGKIFCDLCEKKLKNSRKNPELPLLVGKSK